ncbi:MAG: hypothetical protein AB7D42_03055 [Candidatus Methanomethylophilaceae archaeon]
MTTVTKTVFTSVSADTGMERPAFKDHSVATITDPFRLAGKTFTADADDPRYGAKHRLPLRATTTSFHMQG